MNDLQKRELEEILLKKVTVVAALYFDRETIEQLKVTLQNPCWSDTLVAQLWGYFDTEQVEEETVKLYYEDYATWWDRFKAEALPSWVSRRLQIDRITKPKEITVKHSCVFPRITKLEKGYRSLPFVRRIEQQ